MKQHKRKLIIGSVVLAILAFSFWWGGNAPGLSGWNIQNTDEIRTSAEMAEETSDAAVAEKGKSADETESGEGEENKVKLKGEQATLENKPSGDDGRPMTADEKVKLAMEMAGGSAGTVVKGDVSYSEANGMKIDASTGKDKYLTDPVPAGKPVPVEPQTVTISDKELTCTLSVRCDTILDNMAWLDKEKVELVPKDGVIYAERTVTFYEGESVFNLLLREMKKNKIHMEFTNTPMYNSAYIEGINNLYEFDCGELSGWMYKVNGWFPNYGCSRYQLKQGDKVEWVYTCDLGVDVGGFSVIVAE
ncbi:MAG: DUF4430 domain-containing protein [Anaerovoracaceae bacterium]